MPAQYRRKNSGGPYARRVGGGCPRPDNQFDGHTESFELDAYKKICLMNAQDDIDYLLSTIDDIERYEKSHS